MARPLLFQSPEELQQKIDEFLVLVKAGEEEPSVVGLACFLGTTKQTITAYQGRADFKDIIDDAKQHVESLFTAKAYKGEIPPAIFIFTAKNHYEYKDSQDLNLGGQKGNPIKYDDTQRNARIAELLNKRGGVGVIGVVGSGEASTD